MIRGRRFLGVVGVGWIATLALVALPAPAQTGASVLRIDADLDVPFYALVGGTGAVRVMAAGDSLRLRPGLHEVVLATPYHADHRFEVELRPDETFTYRVHFGQPLTDRAAYLVSSSYPVLYSGANLHILADERAEVYVDGRLRGHGTVRLDTVGGTYRVAAIHPTFGRSERVVDVLWREALRLTEADFYGRPTRRDVLRWRWVPGVSQWRRHERARAVAFGGAWWAGAVGTALLHRRYVARRRRLEHAQATYAQATSEEAALTQATVMEQAYAAARGAARYQLGAAGLAGALYVFHLLDARRPPAGGFRTPDPVVGAPVLAPDQAGLWLELTF